MMSDFLLTLIILANNFTQIIITFDINKMKFRRDVNNLIHFIFNFVKIYIKEKKRILWDISNHLYQYSQLEFFVILQKYFRICK